MGNKQPSLQKQIFDMKFTSKQLERRHAKYEKESKKKKAMVKKYIEQNNMEMAQEYAQQANNAHKTAMNFLSLSSRLDGVASRLQSAEQQQRLTPVMTSAVRGMDLSMQQMDIEKLTRMMDKFGEIDENFRVTESYMNETIGGTVAASTPVDQVDALMEEVAAAHGLEIARELDAHMAPTGAVAQQEEGSAEVEDQLEERLAAQRALAS